MFIRYSIEYGLNYVTITTSAGQTFEGGQVNPNFDLGKQFKFTR